MKYGSDGETIVATNRPVGKLCRANIQHVNHICYYTGKNTAADYSKQIAQSLSLPNAPSYTSHSFKRTSLTWMADENMTTNQIQNHSGHKSAKVVQNYIANSNIQKRTASTALAMEYSTSSSCSSSSTFSSKRSSEQQLQHQQQQGQVVFNFNAPINIASGGTFYGSVYPALQPNQIAERVVNDMTVTNTDETKE